MLGKVLVVEDEALIAEAVAEALRDAGYEVCGVASSEAEAMQIARGAEPDLAVVDVRLAPGDGRTVARELAERFETTVLMATTESATSLHDIGAQAVIPKPYSPALIPSAIEAAQRLSDGEDPGTLPDHMVRLRSGL